MATAMVRVSKAAWRTLKDLSRRRGETMQEVFDRALEEYRRKLFLEEANRAFSEIRKNPQAWLEELGERKAWEVAMADGLEEGE